jgi:hypothetical protein
MEAFPLRAVAHDERLTLTGHLSELRARLLLSVAVLAVLFAGCLWQSRLLLHVLNVPLTQLRASSPAEGAGGELPQALARSASAFNQLAHATSLAPAGQRAALDAARSLVAANRALARPDARAPVTLGLGEPFSTSITVAFAFALLLGLPFLVAQAWAFAAPALAPADRRAVRPLLSRRPGALRHWGGVCILLRLAAGRHVPTAVQPRRVRCLGSGARVLPLRAHDHALPGRDLRNSGPSLGPGSRGHPQLDHPVPPPPLCHRRGLGPRRPPTRNRPVTTLLETLPLIPLLRGHHHPAQIQRA